MNRPVLGDNRFQSNVASYGPNIASYAVRIINRDTQSNKISINNAASGLPYTQNLVFAIVDYDYQVMNLQDSAVVKITPVDNYASVTSIDYAKFTKGIATFTKPTFKAIPGHKNVEYTLRSLAINDMILSNVISTSESDLETYHNLLYVNFRFCMPGEIQTTTNICEECSYGTYSFTWNSTVCKSCMSHAECVGKDNISVNQGYWRKTTNSTTILACIRDESCIGGYYPENENPVQCAEGYEGLLCSQCQIINGTKYQPLSNYECVKCPDPTMNMIRVVGFIILALLFLILIMVINIRKKKENQFSILLRIFTNYMQLISAAMTFNISLPTSFQAAFSQTDRFSSPNETFFSFDCFITNADIRLFTPSNKLFKLFLYCFLPLVLLIAFTIFLIFFRLVMHIRKPQETYDLRRYIGISLICIVFLFHPTMIYESLSTFQCVQIDEGEYRMKMYMEYS